MFCKQIIFNFLLIFWILLFNQRYSRCSKKTSIKLLSLRFLLVAAKLTSKNEIELVHAILLLIVVVVVVYSIEPIQHWH